VKTDRASTLASLEARAPFLDHTLVDFHATVPPHLRLRFHAGNVLLERAVAELLPPGIAERKKKGFGIPVASSELCSRLWRTWVGGFEEIGFRLAVVKG
jgi:asparagine synthase (glutamine-hydrolysing)